MGQAIFTDTIDEQLPAIKVPMAPVRTSHHFGKFIENSPKAMTPLHLHSKIQF
jgi:hypothetical protein